MVYGYLGVEARPSQVLQLSPKEAWGIQPTLAPWVPHSPHFKHLVTAALAQVRSFASQKRYVGHVLHVLQLGHVYICVIFFFSKKPPEGKGQLDIAEETGLNSYMPGNKFMSRCF